MRLLTEMQDGCVHAIGCCIDAEVITRSEVARLEHDAAAAHALMQALDDVLRYGFYIETKSRLTQRADEILREWGFDNAEAA